MTKNISVNIVEGYNELSVKAAQIFSAKLKENPRGVFGFATGSSPAGMYAELTQMHLAGEIDMSGLTAFNLDEYYSLRPDDPQSYAAYMANTLFDKVGIPNERRNIPSGETKNPDGECLNYEKKIHEAGGIKFQILGIGENGHIGFNEPSDAFAGQTNLVELAESTIKSNSRFFNVPAEVPRHALTMGIGTIMMAEQILLLVSGDSKANALRDSLTGPITPRVPGSALQLHRNVIVVADKAAAKYL